MQRLPKQKISWGRRKQYTFPAIPGGGINNNVDGDPLQDNYSHPQCVRLMCMVQAYQNMNVHVVNTVTYMLEPI